MTEHKEEMFQVVTNHEEQYSIWPESKKIPAGWVAVGPSGAKERCLDYIEWVWTDMRPRSLRLEMRKESTESLGTSRTHGENGLRSGTGPEEDGATESITKKSSPGASQAGNMMSSSKGCDEDLQEQIRSVTQEVLEEHERYVEEYAEGRAELFGWFLARILEEFANEEITPDLVRAYLNLELPDIHID